MDEKAPSISMKAIISAVLDQGFPCKTWFPVRKPIIKRKFKSLVKISFHFNKAMAFGLL
jgi:hypothetical protein